MYRHHAGSSNKLPLPSTEGSNIFYNLLSLYYLLRGNSLPTTSLRGSR
nr:MAG TPA: hypothetical protein [Caudoviricetes sp.]